LPGSALAVGTDTGERRLRGAALRAAAIATLTRLPFAARRLWDHDSVQFALGMERYDLAAHHPHPPGYPLYIALLKGLAMAGLGPVEAMVALSILATALGAGAIVRLTGRLVVEAGCTGSAGRLTLDPGAPLAAGVLAAALYVFNPLLWFYGELPLVYAVEGGMTVALAYAAWRMADGARAFVFGCGAFALAGGIRPSTLLLLLPLFALGVWRAWRRGLSRVSLLTGAAMAVAAGLAWLLPLLAAAGGLAAYLRIGREHFSALLPYTSILYGAGWPALAHNLTLIAKWFLQGLLPAGVTLAALWLLPSRTPGARQGPTSPDASRSASKPMGSESSSGPGRQELSTGSPDPAGSAAESASGYALAANRGSDGGGPSPAPASKSSRPSRFPPLRDGLRCLAANAPFLAAWCLPPVLFFALFHITKGGYTLVYLPALLVGASLLAVPALGAGGSGRAVAGAGLAAAVGAGLFLFGADRRPDQPRAFAIVRHEFNRSAISTYERDLDRLLAALRWYPPSTTVLATVELSGTGPGGPEAFLYPWQRHLQWYLPDYEVLHLVPEERLALVTRGHQPFHREGTHLVLPAATRQLAIVLSGPTGERLPLSGWPQRRIGTTFYLVIVPFPGHLRLGSFDLETSRRDAA
jgi:Protein of unknown function (DUF2723)